MKLEEILPHLRAGGKVKIPGRAGWEFTTHELTNQFSFLALQLIEDFEIVKTPRKYEFEAYIGESTSIKPESHCPIDNAIGHKTTRLFKNDNIFTRYSPDKITKFKVTMEEILE